jgi:glycosyltransferase involved in cell wall biosynthesis
MRFAIYARGLSGVGGVKEYIESMCRALIEALGPSDELAIVHNLDAPRFASGRANVFEKLLSSRHRPIADFVAAPRVLNALKPDVVWFTKYVVPFGIDAPCVTTVHDMAYFMPELNAYPLSDAIYMRTMIRNSMRRADHVVAVSHNTKSDIHRFLDVPDEKVSVIHEAADAKYKRIRNKQRITEFKNKYRLPDKYLLFTGGISPRKNLNRLIDAYNAVAHLVEHKLVLTGTKGWKNEEVLSAIRQNDHIIKLGFVDDDDMPLLYNAASLFLYPSLYEGFGLPVLEAGQCGCPVVCGKGSSLTEVGGNGAYFVDARDTAALSDAMLRLLFDDALRRRLIADGLENARRFSWKRSAKALLALLGAVSRQRT